MEYAAIPGTKLKPSRIGLGTWAIGGWMWGGSDEESAVRAIHAALNQGINLIDTAPVYGFGRSEEIVGRAVAAYGGRERILLATKVGLQWDERERVTRNASAARIEAEVEASLRRLRTDYIDVYQVHWPDPRVPVEETARAMERLHRDGRIRAVGVSNFGPNQLDAFREVAPLHVVQPPLNLFERGAQADVLPHCERHGLATLTYGVLCRGLLSGAMDRNRVFHGDDLRRNDPKFQAPRFDQYLAAVEALDAFARDSYGRGVRELAVRWALDQPGVTTVLWGARRPDQLDGLDGALGWSLDDGALARIDAIVAENVADPIGPEFMAPPAREG